MYIPWGTTENVSINHCSRAETSGWHFYLFPSRVSPCSWRCPFHFDWMAHLSCSLPSPEGYATVPSTTFTSVPWVLLLLSSWEGRHLAFVSSFLETCQVERSCLLEQWWRHSVFLQGPELGFERCETAEHYLNALPKKYKTRRNSPSIDARSKTSIPVTTVAWKFLSWLLYISSSFHCVELENLCVSLMSGSLGIFK